MSITCIKPRGDAARFFDVESDSCYKPRILIYERTGELPEKLDDKSKGVYILVNIQKGITYVYIGFSGVSGKGSLFHRLDALCRTSDKLPPGISDWKKAILIYKWQNDIEAWLNEVVEVKEKEEKK